MGILLPSPPFLTFIEACEFKSPAEIIRTNVRLANGLETFDARPRVRVYYIKLTRKNIVGK